MTFKTHCLLILVSVCGFACNASAERREITDPAEAKTDPDFSIQGEYLGEGLLPDGNNAKAGAQVIALGEGQFHVVLFEGGLPGAGWKRGDKQFAFDAKREGDTTQLHGADVSGKIAGGAMTITDPDGKRMIRLERTERTSPTSGAKPPEGAVVLFDGGSADNFDHGVLSKHKALVAGATTKREFDSYNLHMEFRLSYMPQSRGQGRSNSGVYLHDCYEIQVLDSFGLEGRDNECGGIYRHRPPDVNMCLPPLAWQTYDVELTAPKYDSAGKKTAAARMTVRHNGVVIHQDYELPGYCPGRKDEGPGPRAIHFQGHGCHVHYRNIWLVPRQ